MNLSVSRFEDQSSIRAYDSQDTNLQVWPASLNKRIQIVKGITRMFQGVVKRTVALFIDGDCAQHGLDAPFAIDKLYKADVEKRQCHHLAIIYMEVFEVLNNGWTEKKYIRRTWQYFEALDMRFVIVIYSSYNLLNHKLSFL